MTRILKSTAVAALALMAVASQAATTVDANVEIDTTYFNKAKDTSVSPNVETDRGFGQSGRVEVNISGKTEGGGFVAGRGTLIASRTGSGTTDDMWVQFGNSAGDIKLGRFEAADLFNVNRDVIVESYGGYRTNLFRGREGSITTAGTGGSGGGAPGAHAAVTINAMPELSVEIGLIAQGKNAGIRPVVAYSANGMTVKAGLESGKDINSNKVEGFGATASFAMAGDIVINASLGMGKTTANNAGYSIKGNSFNVNAAFGPAFVGYSRDKTDGYNNGTADIGGVTSNNVYVNYTLPLFDTKAVIVPALSLNKTTDKGTSIGAGVRVHYDF